MKRLIALLALFCLPALAQNSDRHLFAQLTSTCSNANSTCDTAGTTVFGGLGDVLGPQTIEANVQGYGLATITASGTYSGSIIQFEFSDDGGTTWYPNTCARVDTNIQEGSEAVTTNAFRAWECSVGAATRMRVRQSAITTGGPVIGVTLTSGIVEPAPTNQLSQSGSNGSNPCANPHTNLQSAFVAMSTTSLTQFVAAVTGQKFYVCSVVATNSTATNPVTISYGTGSNCATGTQLAIDKFTAPASTASPVVIYPGFVTPVSQALCYQQFGTTPTGSLLVNYVQQ